MRPERGLTAFIMEMEHRRDKYRRKVQKYRRPKHTRRLIPDSELDRKFSTKLPKYYARADKLEKMADRVSNYDQYDRFELDNPPELWFYEFTGGKRPSRLTPSLRGWYERNPNRIPEHDTRNTIPRVAQAAPAQERLDELVPVLMALRVVSYAINGRGMGHLVRQLAILRWVRRYASLLDTTVECWVLTSSEADTLARREQVPSLKMPSKAMMRDAGIDPHRYLAIARGWVLNALAGLQPDVLIVDTFPAGSFGELVAALEMARTRVLVRRRVKAQFAEEEAYQALLPLYNLQVDPDDRGCGPIVIREREELLPKATARAALGIPDGGSGRCMSRFGWR